MDSKFTIQLYKFITLLNLYLLKVGFPGYMKSSYTPNFPWFSDSDLSTERSMNILMFLFYISSLICSCLERGKLESLLKYKRWAHFKEG